MNKSILLVFATVALIFTSCKKEDSKDEPQLIFKLKFDPTQVRLDGQGNVSELPDTHSAQTPDFNAMSAHYIELTPNEFTLPGKGVRVYEGAVRTDVPKVTVDGNDLSPIDFAKAKVKDEGEVFFSIPLKDVKSGTYPYIRVSVTYQSYDIVLKAAGINNIKATVASFVGYGQYLQSIKIFENSLSVNASKPQGFWAVEDHLIENITSGQAPPGATTVPNPLAGTSAIAEGSCLVTGVFDTPFTITGNETEDVTVTLSFSINNSFEWHDINKDGIYEPDNGDKVVDMGLRGLIPIVE